MKSQKRKLNEKSKATKKETTNGSMSLCTGVSIPNEMLKELKRVRGYLVDHRMLSESQSDAMTSITTAEPGGMSIIVGPTRVGKTTLLRSLSILCTSKFKTKKGMAPVVTVEFKANEEIKFNWKDFYFRLLLQINKAAVDEYFIRPGTGAIPSYRANENVLRRTVEQSLRNRGTKVILVDEAQHIAMGQFSGNLQNQMEVLKSFANMTGLHLVLCGPYQLLRPLRSSGQLASRGSLIHFPRYKMNECDLLEFHAMVKDLVDQMKPWQCDFSVEKHLLYFYERSLGLVGLLKPWFLMAAEYCANKKSWIITKDILDETAKSPLQLITIANEMTIGEKEIAGTPEDWNKLHEMLKCGFDPFSWSPNVEVNGDKSSAPEESEVPPKRKLHPGERSPVRDRIEPSDGQTKRGL